MADQALSAAFRYVSGHSTVSAACARVLELFTGSDAFGAVEQRQPGELTEPGVSCQVMQGSDGQRATDTTLSCEVALQLPTFSSTAEMAGLSRVLGGYHIQANNLEGLKLGRKVAAFDWPLVHKYFDGSIARAVIWSPSGRVPRSNPRCGSGELPGERSSEPGYVPGYARR